MAVLGDSVALPAGTQVPAGWRSRGGPSGGTGSAVPVVLSSWRGVVLFYFKARWPFLTVVMLLIKVKPLACGAIPTHLSRLREIAHVVNGTPEMEMFFYLG